MSHSRSSLKYSNRHASLYVESPLLYGGWKCTVEVALLFRSCRYQNGSEQGTRKVRIYRTRQVVKLDDVRSMYACQIPHRKSCQAGTRKLPSAHRNKGNVQEQGGKSSPMQRTPFLCISHLPSIEPVASAFRGANRILTSVTSIRNGSWHNELLPQRPNQSSTDPEFPSDAECSPPALTVARGHSLTRDSFVPEFYIASTLKARAHRRFACPWGSRDQPSTRKR